MKKQHSILKRRAVRNSFLTMLAISLLVLAPAVQAARIKTFKHIRLSTSSPKENWFYGVLEYFANEVKKESDGSLNVVIYPSAQLYKESEVTTMMKKGTLEIAPVIHGFFLGSQPKQWGVFVPTYLKDRHHTARYLFMSEAGNMMLEDDMVENGLVNLGILFLMNDFTMVSNKSIKTVADLKGIKIRMPGPFYSPLVKLHGMTPVTITTSEAHMALSRGTVDAIFAAPHGVAGLKWFEVAKYFNVLRGFQSGFYTFTASKKFWKKLHPSQKKALLTAAYRATLHSYKVGLEEERKDLEIVLSQTKNHSFNDDETDKFLSKIRPVIKPGILDKFGGPDLAPVVLKSVAETKDMKETAEEAAKLGYERKLKYWGLD